MTKSIVIIGSGITGAMCASLLCECIPSAQIKVLDKARGVGGRMTTSRSTSGVHSQADLGAQYVTTDNDYLKKFGNIYNRLLHGSKPLLQQLEAKVEGMKKFPSNINHFVAPEGMGSLVKSFLSDVPASSVQLNRQVVSIKLDSDKLIVKTADGLTDLADIVISTLPVPQFLNLNGINDFTSSNVSAQLENVSYSTRFVLIWFYESTNCFPLPDWAAKYLDDEIFRYVAIDSRKRNQNEPPAVVFHSSIQFGATNASKTKEEICDQLQEKARALFPDWPKPSCFKCHKWLYSQVSRGYADSPGCLVLQSKPLLILAGDAFTASNFNGCIESAQATIDAVLKYI